MASDAPAEHGQSPAGGLPVVGQGLPLAGRGILVTRPREQAAGLAGRIHALGGTPILYPVLEILDVSDLSELDALIGRLDTFDLAIFISPTAVHKAMNLVRARREWPLGLRAAAIGRGSAKELAHYGLASVLAPSGKFDSEQLLALPELQQVAGQRVVIFRGDGGREILGDTLTARGARVEYAECYRRSRPDAGAGELLRHWARAELDAVTVTSSEGLRNLYDMVGKLARHWLKRTPLFVPHERIAAAARELGLERVELTGPGDDGLMDALVAYYGRAEDGRPLRTEA